MKKEKLRSTADILTLLRAATGIPLIYFLNTGSLAIAWFLLFIGALTDLVDGWLARKFGGGSSWGAKLDPLADKVLISAPMIWLASVGLLPIWAVWLLISRELIISSLRSSENDGMPASKGGKVKTVLQFFAVLLMIWPFSWGGTYFALKVQRLGVWVFWPTLILTILSGIKYLKKEKAFRQH